MLTYLDNAASTEPLTEVVDAVARTMRDHYANPSSLHGPGTAAARALGEAREQVAALVHAADDEIVFTGSGTEANALALLGAARASRLRHVVLTGIEHAAVWESARLLGEQGWKVTEVAPERNGCVTPEAVVAAVTPETSVIAVMLVNNEIGTLQPIAEIVRAVRALGRKLHIHVDGVQSAGLVPVDVRTKGMDSLALSAHKLHGPKGVGALWLRKGRRALPLYGGGGQERGLRSGTENVPLCVGFGVAATAARADASAHARVAELRDRFEQRVFATIAGVSPAVPLATPRAPQIAGILLPGLPAEPVLHALEARGVIASEGAACSTHSREPSRVMRALGVPTATGTLRFSLSRLTTAADVDRAVSALVEAVAQIAATARPGR